MLHSSVSKCCLLHCIFIAQTRTSFEKFQKEFYFLSLFSFSGFALFHFTWLKKDQGYLGLGGELAPELLKSWLVPGIAGTPDGALGGYLLFLC